MRRWKVGFVAILLALSVSASAAARPKGVKLKARIVNNQLRVKAGTHQKFAVHFNCITIRHYKMVGSQRVPIIIRRCPDLFGGSWFEVATIPKGGGDGEGAVTSEFVADPPEFELQMDAHWYTQRIGYFWLDPKNFPSNGSFPHVAYAPLMDGTEQRGTATLVPDRVEFDPGGNQDGDLDWLECDLTKIFEPYDRRLPHFDERRPQPSCSYVYRVSSLRRPYHPRVKIYWKVVSVQLSDVPAFLQGNYPITGLRNLESSSTPKDLRVKEIQTILTCVSTSTTDCAAGR